MVFGLREKIVCRLGSRGADGKGTVRSIDSSAANLLPCNYQRSLFFAVRVRVDTLHLMKSPSSILTKSPFSPGAKLRIRVYNHHLLTSRLGNPNVSGWFLRMFPNLSFVETFRPEAGPGSLQRETSFHDIIECMPTDVYYRMYIHTDITEGRKRESARRSLPLWKLLWSAHQTRFLHLNRQVGGVLVPSTLKLEVSCPPVNRIANDPYECTELNVKHSKR